MANSNNWGGARPGAGRKKKSLAERIQDGQIASPVHFPVRPKEPVHPDVKSYLSDEQRIGELHAKEIYEETWYWLKDRDCLYLINPHLIEQYAMSMGRWVQLEKLISEVSPISKQINGEFKSSPLVSMAQNYLREARLLWNEIWYIVQANCTEKVSENPQDDMMERLLGE